jgi:sugar phosphate isomerase/epimerase
MTDNPDGTTDDSDGTTDDPDALARELLAAELIAGAHDALDHQPTDPGKAILGMARELLEVAAALGAPYLTAHVPAVGGELVALTVEHGKVTLTGVGFEIQILLDPE